MTHLRDLAAVRVPTRLIWRCALRDYLLLSLAARRALVVSVVDANRLVAGRALERDELRAELGVRMNEVRFVGW
jgi:hypothetical protein